MLDLATLPVFKPHLLIPGGHAQTLAGVFLPARRIDYRARRHVVTLADGDQLVVHDDCPNGWQPPARTALLIHGLAGSHLSGYMQRTAAKLCARGVRAFRLDLRGCGAGLALARLPYHSGRSEDAAAVIEFIAGLCAGSPLTLIGYSLGGNITLKLLGELGDRACGGLDSGIAVCPPMHLAACAERISRRVNRLYDRHFVRMLERSVALRRRLRPDVPGMPAGRRARTLEEFDELYTAPVSGFGTAENYYRLASSLPLLGAIRRPTWIVAADDDPLIPQELFRDRPESQAVHIHVTRGGGHLGFIAASKFGGPDKTAGDCPNFAESSEQGTDRRLVGTVPFSEAVLSGPLSGDRRWLDWRILDWIVALDGAVPQPHSSKSQSGNSVRRISRFQSGS